MILRQKWKQSENFLRSLSLLNANTQPGKLSIKSDIVFRFRPDINEPLKTRISGWTTWERSAEPAQDRQGRAEMWS